MNKLCLFVAIALFSTGVFEIAQAAQSGGGKPPKDTASALRIVDANGVFVGFPFQFTQNGFDVLRKIPSLGVKPYFLSVDVNGFLDKPIVQFMYTSNNCTGDRYIQSRWGHDFADPWMYNPGMAAGAENTVVAGIFYFAATPFQTINVNSIHNFNLSTNTQDGGCLDWSGQGAMYEVGNLDSVDLYSTLGVQAPFRIE